MRKVDAWLAEGAEASVFFVGAFLFVVAVFVMRFFELAELPGFEVVAVSCACLLWFGLAIVSRYFFVGLVMTACTGALWWADASLNVLFVVGFAGIGAVLRAAAAVMEACESGEPKPASAMARRQRARAARKAIADADARGST